MSLPDLYAELERVEALNAVTLPELVQLEQDSVIPFIRDEQSRRPTVEPTEALARFNELRTERWPVRRLEDIRREIGSMEATARACLFHIAECDREIARMSALPQADERRAARIAEEIAALARIRATHQRKLEVIGMPRQVLTSDSMKVVA